MRKFRQRHNALTRPRAGGKGLKVRAGESGTAELLVYDVIGWPFIEAQDVVARLQDIDAARVLVRINSPGGDVFDGLAIYNALKEHPARVDTLVEGLAASIASIVALAGQSVEAAESSFVMIHNPWTCMCGDAEEFRHAAGVLDKIGGQLAAAYAAKTGADLEQVRAWMGAETWYTAQEARDAGLVDRVLGDGEEEAQAALAGFDLSIFDHVPERLAALAGASGRRERPTEREFERHLREAGFSRNEAAGIVAHGYRAVMRGEPADALVAGLESLTHQLRNMTR